MRVRIATHSQFITQYGHASWMVNPIMPCEHMRHKLPLASEMRNRMTSPIGHIDVATMVAADAIGILEIRAIARLLLLLILLLLRVTTCCSANAAVTATATTQHTLEQVATVLVEYLHTVVEIVTDQDATFAVGADVGGLLELDTRTAIATQVLDHLAVAAVHSDVIALEIGHHHVLFVIVR